MKIALLLAVFCLSLFSQTFNPIADTDTQSDTSAGTNANISVSRWCTALIKFDLASGPDSVGRALLRLYFPGGIPSCTLYLKAATPDTWIEGGVKPAAGSSISSVLLTSAVAGYADIDITPYVKTRMAANKIVSLALNSSISGWVSINSRQAVSNKPELVIAGSNGNPFAVTGVSVSPSRAFVYSGRSLKLSIQVFPDNAEDTVIIWKSSDSSIVRVNSNGEIYGMAQGNATVVATSRQNAKKDTCEVSVRVLPGTNDMSGGCNFWNIGWEGTSHFFKSGLNWAAVSDPWNPVLISELQQAGMNCLRFMDWNVVNYSCVKEWNQRIQKTANHYNTANTVPCFTDIYDDSANTHTLVWNGQTHYGVAVEWQIDLCNRVGADLWINIPATATSDFERQLALLIKAQLDTSLKVYVEWANEVWNWNFSSTVYARNMADSLRLDTLNYGGAYMLPWRAYTVYASVRAFEHFENVFGKNSPRIVKVIAGQVGYHWNGYDYNHMVNGDLAALNNRIVNPNSVSIDAYAMAPYMGGSTITAQRAALSGDAQYMRWAKNSLNGTSIKLICYEAGADNYPDQTLVLTRDVAQEQLNYDYLAMLDDYCQGPVNQYCMYGGCWGLKNYPGESEANAPKWRGWLNYWGGFTVKSEDSRRTAILPSLSSAPGFLPNPVSGYLNIALRKHETALVRIVDIKGQVLINKQITGMANRVSLLQCPAGIYFIEVDKGAKVTREKLVILR